MASMLLFCIHLMYYTVAMERNLFDNGYDHWVPPPLPFFFCCCIPLQTLLHPISDIPKHEVYAHGSTHISLNGMAQRLEGSAGKCGRWKHNIHKRVTWGSIHWDFYCGLGIVEFSDARKMESLFLTLSTVITVWLTAALFISCVFNMT